jgi:hypothetical protein
MIIDGECVRVTSLKRKRRSDPASPAPGDRRVASTIEALAYHVGRLGAQRDNESAKQEQAFREKLADLEAEIERRDSHAPLRLLRCVR